MHPLLAERKRLALYLAAWVPIAALLAALLNLSGPLTWWDASLLALPLAFFYAFLCLPAWYLCRAFPLDTTEWTRLIAMGLAASFLTAILWVILGESWASLLSRIYSPGIEENYVAVLPLLLGLGEVMFLLSLVVHYLVIVFEAARNAERQSLESEVLAREIELKVLKAQVDPHFLFNSLNSVSSLIGSDPPGAREMCLLLAEFLRTSLKLVNQPNIPLSEELALVERFLTIERVRFGSRLRLEIDVDPRSESSLVPPLLLQPLVENAVKHGVAHRLDGATVRIRSEIVGDDLRLSVENECDADRPDSLSTKIGLENVRSRLRTLYPNDARMDFREEDGKFVVELRLPFLVAFEAASSAPTLRSSRDGVRAERSAG